MAPIINHKLARAADYLADSARPPKGDSTMGTNGIDTEYRVGGAYFGSLDEALDEAERQAADHLRRCEGPVTSETLTECTVSVVRCSDGLVAATVRPSINADAGVRPCNADALARAAGRLDAVRMSDGRYAYHDDVLHRWYLVSASDIVDVADLVDYLDSDDERRP
jgi:hypothetical protein